MSPNDRPTEVVSDVAFTTRPVITGDRGVVAAGHYLAAQAGARMLDRGGNAIDACVAGGFVLSLVKPHHNGMGGEVPILVAARPRPAEPHEVVAISGQGPAPINASIDWFRSRKIHAIPGDGFLPATVPGAFGAWCTALLRFGTLNLAEVLSPALELAEDGYVVDPVLATYFARSAPRFRAEWPSSVACFWTEGRPPRAGERLRQPMWARTFKALVDISIRERRRGRDQSILAAIDAFYRGDVAERLVRFQRSTEISDATGARHAGLLTIADFAAYEPRVEAPVSIEYSNVEVFKCGPWTQGPVFLQQLALLAGYELAAMRHNSAEYVHLLVEVAKLAFADRERYYGDPLFSDVPLGWLLSRTYADSRRSLIDSRRATTEISAGAVAPAPSGAQPQTDWAAGDTTHIDVADQFGNMISATPSGGWLQASPVVPEVGFPLGTRAQQFTLEPDRPNSLAPGKRPRITLTPSLAFRSGRPWLAFGTPGGDYQDQWSLQFLMNVLHFDMGLQEAIDAPTFHTDHFPSSFYPHEIHVNQLVIEDRIDESVRTRLGEMGHQVLVADGWANGQVTAVRMRDDGGVEGAASPRTLVPYVVGR